MSTLTPKFLFAYFVGKNPYDHMDYTYDQRIVENEENANEQEKEIVYNYTAWAKHPASAFAKITRVNLLTGESKLIVDIVKPLRTRTELNPKAKEMKATRKRAVFGSSAGINAQEFLVSLQLQQASSPQPPPDSWAWTEPQPVEFDDEEEHA